MIKKNLILTIIVMSSAFLSFRDTPSASTYGLKRTETAVVFGGGEGRVDAALDLLQRQLIHKVYFSGENFDFYPRGFVSFFSARGHDRHEVKRLLECCIEWDKSARNTIENAADIACWLRRRKIHGPILLITSHWHMRRALMLLSDQLHGQEIVPYTVIDRPGIETPGSVRILEFAKYLLTRSIRPILWIDYLPIGRTYGCRESPN